ncbi:BrnA antitoxin family protein [Candidatus Saccharibacteria bacterium]|nr:BrnA antitoxin family protein [Candidatus Saccharibacteria bacterium]
MGTTRTILGKEKRLTRAEKAELKAAFKRPVVFDEDAPELTDAQLKAFAEAARLQRAEQKKEVVALRLSPETIKKAKATGKGYTGFLARLIENAMKDQDLVRRSL